MRTCHDAHAAGGGSGQTSRPPSREEVEAKINRAQKQLAEAQRRVEVLKAGLGGEYRTEPLDEAKGSR